MLVQKIAGYVFPLGYTNLNNFVNFGVREGEFFMLIFNPIP